LAVSRQIKEVHSWPGLVAVSSLFVVAIVGRSVLVQCGEFHLAR
jgi:uncharacterized iron-regulated membrane protein